VLARTITVHTDVGTFERFLSIPGSNDVHALSSTATAPSWPAIAAGLLVA
jgi:hypothetical protein